MKAQEYNKDNMAYDLKAAAKGRGVEINKPAGVESGAKAEVMGHASPVYSVNTASERSDMGRMNYQVQNSRGYPSQAWEYNY